MLKKQYLVILVLVSTLFLSFEATPVFAGTPTITNVALWNNGGNTTLNVTISHFPAGTSQHHVDAIEANISGAIETLMVPVESTTEFTIAFDLGPINGNPSATLRAHCNLHGWSLPYGPIQVPEFSPSVLLLALIFATILSKTAYQKFNAENRNQSE